MTRRGISEGNTLVEGLELTRKEFAAAAACIWITAASAWTTICLFALLQGRHIILTAVGG